MEVIKGRMYDYNNGRFLSVDPFIASKSNMQALNPYSYIGNNPLSGTDPTGYNPLLLLRSPAIGTALGEGAGAVAGFFIRRAIAKHIAKEAARTLIKSKVAQLTVAAIAIKSMITPDETQQNPGFVPSDNKPQILTTPVADSIESSGGFQQADPSPTSLPGAEIDSGIGGIGIMTNEEKDNSSIGDQSNKPPFELDTNGTPDSIRADLDAAGYPGKPTTETQENGTMHEGVVGEGGEMDVRVMDGQSNSGEYSGPRVVTTRPGTKDYVKSDGSKFRNNETRSQRQQGGHTQLKTKSTIRPDSRIIDRKK